jgi:hypothetical protein
MLQIFKSKTFRIGAALLVLIGLYALAGFVILPKLVRSALLEDIPKSIGATPTVGEIHINPFLFQATVDNFALAGAGGEKLLGFQRLFVDFQLSSIWHRAYTFVNIDITAPHVSAVMAKDGALNLLQLRPKPGPAPKPEKNEPLPALRIGSFKVSQGLVAYEDRSRPDVFAARLEPINFELRDFTTGVEGGKFTFTGASKLGERIEWHGHVSVDPVESDGEFQISGLLARTLWEYLQDQVNFVVDSGTLNVAGTYKFALENAADNLQLDVSKVALRDLAVRPKNAAGDAAAAPWITVPELDVTGTHVDLAQRRAHVDLVTLAGVKLSTWLEPDGALNLMKLAAAPPGPTPTPATAAAPPAAFEGRPAGATTAGAGSGSNAPAAAAPPWTYDVRQLDVRDASISSEDRGVHPAVKVTFAPFSLRVDGVSQDLTKPVTVALDTRINEKGSLTVNGEVTPQPLVANVSLKLADVDLGTIQPYIAQHTAMTLEGGTLGADAKLNYGAQNSMPALQFAGNINIQKLHTVDNALKDDFVNWDRLDVLGLKYSQGPDRLDIDQVVARKLYARVIIESDESLNVKRVLQIPPAAPSGATAATSMPTSAAAVSPPAAAAPPVAIATPAVKTSGSRRSAANGKHRSASTQAMAADNAKQGMPMSIKKIVVQASQANFTDLSVTPNFSAGIQSLEGTVVGLSSAPRSRAKVDLHGAVDRFSPVSISGEVNVLGPLYTDLTLSFRNISLAVFNPYSGKFAGYNITKGKLTTELHYLVDGRKLDAQHHVVIEQLEFGDKTASKDAVSLPIKLAVALLKDRNGVIDLDIPVLGSLDDPQFRLAPIIWKVFVNILEKAVTAPFALLGSLFGGGPDIQYVDFRPGVGTLDGPAADKLKAVATALIERPQLKIDVPTGVVPDVDRPALVEAAFAAELSAARASKGGPKKADQLDAATQLELLGQVYAKDFGAEPKYPEAVTGFKSKPDITAAKLDFLGKAIRGHIAIGDGELTTLGQQRAMALQQALLADPQIVAERVFLVVNDKATAKDGMVRLELTLE